MIDLCDINIKKAKSGDVEAAKRLLREFCATVRSNRREDGTPHTKLIGGEVHTHTLFNENLLDYLCASFDAVLSEKTSADIALNLSTKGKRGPKRNVSTRAESLAVGMQAWEEYKSLSGLDDLPPADNRTLNKNLDLAFQAIGKTRNRSHSTVLRDYREWRALVQYFDRGVSADM